MAEILGLVFLLLYLAVIVLLIAGFWKVFTKAGEPRWAIFVPIYNAIVLLKIAGRPAWWFLLFLIPVVGIAIAVIVNIDLAKSFGKGAGFGLAFLPFIFMPMLGFGDATYEGPAAG